MRQLFILQSSHAIADDLPEQFRHCDEISSAIDLRTIALEAILANIDSRQISYYLESLTPIGRRYMSDSHDVVKDNNILTPILQIPFIGKAYGSLFDGIQLAALQRLSGNKSFLDGQYTKLVEHDHSSTLSALVAAELGGKRINYCVTEAEDYARMGKEERDDVVHQNIANNFAKTSILFMGIGHALKGLREDRSLNVKDVLIHSNDYPTIEISGLLPSDIAAALGPRIAAYGARHPEIGIKNDIKPC
jgi:hypothetical protein